MQTNPDPKKQMFLCRKHLENNLSSASHDLLSWKNTGILTDGVFREAAKNIKFSDSPLDITEHILYRILLENKVSGEG
jgi:hypothetical protein